MVENWYLTEVKITGSAHPEFFEFDEDSTAIEVRLESTSGQFKQYRYEPNMQNDIRFNLYRFLNYHLDYTDEVEYQNTDSSCGSILFKNAKLAPQSLAVSNFQPMLADDAHRIVLLSRFSEQWDGRVYNYLMTLDVATGDWLEQIVSDIEELEDALEVLYFKTSSNIKSNNSDDWDTLYRRWLVCDVNLKWGPTSTALYLSSPYQEDDEQTVIELELHWCDEKWQLFDIKLLSAQNLDTEITLQSLKDGKLSRYINLTDFCTCTNTYNEFEYQINSYPERYESYLAIRALCQNIIDPVIDHFGEERFQLTYGFCSKDLKKYLIRKNPESGKPYGRVSPDIDQHMAMELNSNGKLFCKHEGAACDFKIEGLSTNKVIDWVVQAKLPFDMIYYYGPARPFHISYGPKNRRGIYTFLKSGPPSKKGCEKWIEAVKKWD